MLLYALARDRDVRVATLFSGPEVDRLLDPSTIRARIRERGYFHAHTLKRRPDIGALVERWLHTEYPDHYYRVEHAVRSLYV